MVITDTDLQLTQGAAADAARQLADLEADVARTSGELTEHQTSGLAVAMVRQRQAAARAEQMKVERQAQDAARHQRQAAEGAAKTLLDAAAADLTKSAGNVREAFTAAETAIRALVEALVTHDQLVRATAAKVSSVVGPVVDSHGLEFRTGTDRGKVVIRGAWHLPVDPGAVFLRCAWGAARAVLGSQHPLSVKLHDRAGQQQLAGRADGLLAGLTPPPPAATPARPALSRPVHEPPPADAMAPYLRQRAQREAEGKGRL